jgi:tetratricopeptide (TPR) repeat protein
MEPSLPELPTMRILRAPRPRDDERRPLSRSCALLALALILQLVDIHTAQWTTRTLDLWQETTGYRIDYLSDVVAALLGLAGVALLRPLAARERLDFLLVPVAAAFALALPPAVAEHSQHSLGLPWTILAALAGVCTSLLPFTLGPVLAAIAARVELDRLSQHWRRASRLGLLIVPATSAFLVIFAATAPERPASIQIDSLGELTWPVLLLLVLALLRAALLLWVIGLLVATATAARRPRSGVRAEGPPRPRMRPHLPLGLAALCVAAETAAAAPHWLARHREEQRMALCVEAERVLHTFQELDRPAVAAMEARLRRDPDDREARLAVLNHFRMQASDPRRHVRRQLLWLVPRCPEIRGLGYAGWQSHRDPDLAAAWRDAAARRPDDPRVLLNAGEALRFPDPAAAIEYLERAVAVAPGNADAIRSRADAYASQLAEGPPPGRTWNDALRAASAQLAREPGEAFRDAWHRDRRFALAVHASFELGRFAETRQYVARWLTTGTREAVHVGEQFLGRLALRAGDLAAARHQLRRATDFAAPRAGELASVRDGPWPYLGLARELLARGETAAVLEFLRACKARIPPPPGYFGDQWPAQIDRWIDELRSGAVPDFSRHLR